jgi:hypothetical protein
LAVGEGARRGGDAVADGVGRSVSDAMDVSSWSSGSITTWVVVVGVDPSEPEGASWGGEGVGVAGPTVRSAGSLTTGTP